MRTFCAECDQYARVKFLSWVDCDPDLCIAMCSPCQERTQEEYLEYLAYCDAQVRDPLPEDFA